MKRNRLLAAAGLVLAVATTVIIGCSKDKSTNPPGGGGGGGPSWDSGITATVGHSFQFTFTQNGSWGYQCTVHGSAMSGTINVGAAGADSQVVSVGSGGNNFAPQIVNLKNGGYVRWVWVSGNHSATR